MKAVDIAVPARYYVRLSEIMEQSGVPFEELFSRANISTRGLREPDAHLRLSQVETLLDVVYDDFQAPSDIAFELGSMLPASTHSIVGFGMLNSPNVERSLIFLARFFRLVLPTFVMHYARHKNGATVSWRPVIGTSTRCLNFHVETIASAAYREIRELNDQLPRFQIEQSLSKLPHHARYDEFKGVHWGFGRLKKPGVEVRFDYDPSRYPLQTADTIALSVAEARCRGLVQSMARKGSFKEWVLMMLREAGNGQPSLSDLADVLNLSTRTLNRYLKNEGCNFRELANQVQHQLACERLRDPNMSITEIALSLGFTETSNFSRFFSSKAGLSPREYRRQQGEEQANLANSEPGSST